MFYPVSHKVFHHKHYSGHSLEKSFKQTRLERAKIKRITGNQNRKDIKIIDDPADSNSGLGFVKYD